jgi:hypothetical protein
MSIGLVGPGGCDGQLNLSAWDMGAGAEFFVFCPFLGKNSRLDPKKFNVIFGPSARRHSLWRRGNTSRRHRLWRRGTCCAGTTRTTWHRARRQDLCRQARMSNDEVVGSSPTVGVQYFLCH